MRVTIKGRGNCLTAADNTNDLIHSFLAGESQAVVFIENAIDRALSGRSLNLGEARADVHQEALRRLIRSFQGGQFRGDAALATYVYKVAHGAAIDHWRRVRRQREDPEEDHPHLTNRFVEGDQTAVIERGEQRALVERLLARLGSPCRELMIQVYYTDATYAAIGELQGKSEGAIKIQAHRCRQQAAALLRKLSEADRFVTSKAKQAPNEQMPPGMSTESGPQ